MVGRSDDEPSQAADLNRQGQAAHKNGNDAVALRAFLRAHQLAPARAPYVLSAANMALQVGDAKQAAFLLRKAEVLELTPTQRSLCEQKLELLRENADEMGQDSVLHVLDAPRRSIEREAADDNLWWLSPSRREEEDEKPAASRARTARSPVQAPRSGPSAGVPWSVDGLGAPDALVEGWMNKRGSGLAHRWKPRFFVLDGRTPTLRWFAHPPMARSSSTGRPTSMRGVATVTAACVAKGRSKGVLHLTVSGVRVLRYGAYVPRRMREIKVQPASEPDCERWMRAVQHANATDKCLVGGAARPPPTGRWCSPHMDPPQLSANGPTGGAMVGAEGDGLKTHAPASGAPRVAASPTATLVATPTATPSVRWHCGAAVQRMDNGPYRPSESASLRQSLALLADERVEEEADDGSSEAASFCSLSSWTESEELGASLAATSTAMAPTTMMPHADASFQQDYTAEGEADAYA